MYSITIFFSILQSFAEYNSYNRYVFVYVHLNIDKHIGSDTSAGYWISFICPSRSTANIFHPAFCSRTRTHWTVLANLANGVESEWRKAWVRNIYFQNLNLQGEWRPCLPPNQCHSFCLVAFIMQSFSLYLWVLVTALSSSPLRPRCFVKGLVYPILCSFPILWCQ